ncbi:MAG: TetR/AcrR family transcriptional regulator [Acidimicrobiales bacterium]|jgi:AcrR family transcriptional regulator|nr:TetR/AcrR family transcriptional regulator [Acidimicrobiales bacterium]
MTDLDPPELDDGDRPVDGRVARRQRNIDSVLDVVLELFGEEQHFPTIEQVAKRSGLSLRSLYRYFSDPGELLEAAIGRTRERSAGTARLHAIGEGPLARRIDDFVEMRVRLHEIEGVSFRATMANAVRLPRINDELRHNRALMREQFELQFAPELAAMSPADRRTAVAVGDVATQLDTIGLFRRHGELSPIETENALRKALVDALQGRT